MKKLCGMVLALLLVFTVLPGAAFAAETTDFDTEFTQYLSDVSAERGKEVTKEDVEASLAMYDCSIEDFDTVQEIKELLGDVIKVDHSNLSSVYDTYQLTEETLTKLLADNGESIDDYIYLDDLDNSVGFYQYYGQGETGQSGVNEAIINELLPIIMEKVDLSQDELTKLTDYFAAMEDYLASEEVQTKYAALNQRMVDLLTASINGDKTEDQIASEMASIYDEFLPLMKMNAVITLDRDGTKTELTLGELFAMGQLERDDMVTVALYSTNSQLLADLKISGDLFESGLEAENQVENITKEVMENVDNTVTGNHKNSAGKTITGGKLPKTASNHIAYASFGLLAIFAGLFLYRNVRNDKSEISKKKTA